MDRAIQFAVKAHTGQSRKGSDLAYITHPFGVAMLLAQAGCGEDLVIAGLLHDTVEDCGVSLEEIAREFGTAVAAMVEGCSEPHRAAAWEERKQHTVEYLRSAPPEVKLVSCADKLHNVRSMGEDLRTLGEQVWNRFKRGKEQQAWYYRSIVEAFRPEIESGRFPDLFGALAREVEAVFGSAAGA